MSSPPGTVHARGGADDRYFHRGGQGRDSGLRIAQEHLLVQAAQCMEGGVCVLLYKQVSSIDLVDHDDLHSDAVGEHEPGSHWKRRQCQRRQGGSVDIGEIQFLELLPNQVQRLVYMTLRA